MNCMKHIYSAVALISIVGPRHRAHPFCEQQPLLAPKETIMTSIRFASLLAACFTTTALACASSSVPSGTSGGSTAAPTPAAPETVVTSSAGGTITADDGKAILSVPAGAVAADVNVTVSVAARADATASAIYTYKPAGTVFAVPASVSISTANISVPAGKTLGLAVKRDGVWQRISDAKSTTTKIEGPVTTLGELSLVFFDAAPKSSCEDACMSAAGAVCCTSCGCNAEVRCTPTCAAGTKWDCEMNCCFDYEAVKCR